MNCSHCGHPAANEAHRFCTECGQPIAGDEGDAVPQEADAGAEDYSTDSSAEEYGSGDESYSWEEPPPPSALERASEAFSKVLEPVRGMAEQMGEEVQGLLDDPRLRSYLPGGSLTLLGLGLVGLAVLLSALPFVAGIGLVGSGVMLLGGVLVAINEWRDISQPGAQEMRTAGALVLPPALENLPEPTRHPAIAWAYTALACTQALLMLGYGFISLVWMLAAVVLGFDQGRKFFIAGEVDAYAYDVDGTPALRQRLDRWVVVGAAVCSFSLLLPWARNNMPTAGMSGGEQPLATFTQLTLVLLACFALRRRGLDAVHPIPLVIMAVWLTAWFLLMMSPYTVGPWFFLPGLLTLDAVIGLHLLQVRRGGAPDAAPDVDFQE